MVKWSSDLDTGIAVIDQQHRRLLDYINLLNSQQVVRDPRMVGRVLQDVVDYTVSHFGFEESLLEEANYPFLKAHKRVHELFVRRIEDFQKRYAQGENVREEVYHLLSSWLVNHIKHDDADYVGSIKTEIDTITEETTQNSWMSRTLGRFFGRK